MPSVKIAKNQSFEVVWRRFKRSCERAGILGRLRQLESFEKPTAKRKRKFAAAVKRNQRRISKDREALGHVRKRRSKKSSKGAKGRGKK